ncbi:MAG: UDP-N-acetylmuramoyl-L-alanyl-D-glutamate--2,6-diaminopimelate ligase [Deltaproteobacteria bacterium]|nr:UDP-N-acetylmuramoyl-L-alanyl-D-glutamate--2,6-diaminopimelate ligase [Deltaproteobacteria bacterium]
MRLKEFLMLADVEEVNGDRNQEVSGLAYDSRKIGAGQIFFAIPGEKADGHDFVSEAVKRGAAAIVCARKAVEAEGVAFVRVKDVRRVMGQWSAHFYQRPSQKLKLVGVTGTNGKTTVTYLIESMLRAAGIEPGVIGTINYRYCGDEAPAPHTTPESLDLQELMDKMTRAGVKAVTMEVSSHALVQERVCGLDFDVGVFTNLSRDHLDYHRDMNDYFLAKSRLFTDYLKASVKRNKAAVIYADDPRGRELIAKLDSENLEVWSYGEGRQWDIYPLNVERDVGGLRGRIHAKKRTVEFASPLIGAANLQNIMAAVGVGLALGLDTDAVAQGIGQLRAVPGRLEKVANDLGVTILVDYAHTPDALEKVLGAVRPVTPGKLITVFGCGGDRDRGKRPLMGEIAARLSDVVIVTSDNPRTEDPLAIVNEVEAGVQKTGLKKFQVLKRETLDSGPETERGYCVEADRRAAIRIALGSAKPGDSVLIAGKGHEDYQILGTKKIHFDDREVAREELGRRASA